MGQCACKHKCRKKKDGAEEGIEEDNQDDGLLLGYRYKLKDRSHSTEIKDDDKNKKDKTKTKKLFSKSKEKSGINGLRNRKNEPINEVQDEKMGLLQSKDSQSNFDKTNIPNEQTVASEEQRKTDLCNGTADCVEQQKYSSLERRFLSDELKPNINRSIKRQSSIKVLHDSIGTHNIPKDDGVIKDKETNNVNVERDVNKENTTFNDEDKQSIKICLSLSDPNNEPKVETGIPGSKKTNISRSPKFDRAGKSITQLINTINSNTELEAETKLSTNNIIQVKTDDINTEIKSKHVSADVSDSGIVPVDVTIIKEIPIISESDIKPEVEANVINVTVKPKAVISLSSNKPKTESLTVIKDETKRTESSDTTICKDSELDQVLDKSTCGNILEEKVTSNIPDEKLGTDLKINTITLTTTTSIDTTHSAGVNSEPEINDKLVDPCYNENKIDLELEPSYERREITSDIINNNTYFDTKKDDNVNILGDKVIAEISVTDKHKDFDVTAIANSISSEIWSNVLEDLKLFSKKILIDRYTDNLADVIINNNLQHETIDECDAGPPKTVNLSFSNSHYETTSANKIEEKRGSQDVSVVMSIDGTGNFTASTQSNERIGNNVNELPSIVLNDQNKKELDEGESVSYYVPEDTKPVVVLRRKRGNRSSRNILNSQLNENRSSFTDRPVSGFAEQLAELLTKDEDVDFEFASDEELPDALEKIKETYQNRTEISSEIGKIQRKCSRAELSEYGFKKFQSKVKSKIDDKKTKLKGDRPLSLYEQDLLADLLDEDEFDDSNEVAEDTMESVQSSVQFLEDKIPFARNDRSFSNLSSVSTEDYDSHDESTKSHSESKPICNGKAPRLGRAAVIDLGSGILKAGMCGEMEPSCYCPSVVGVPRRFSQDVSKMKKGYYVGDEAWTVAGMLSIDYPLNKPDVTNWPDVTRIIEHLLDSELKVNDRAHPIMLTEKGLASSKHREKLTEIIFETFGVPAFYLANQASLALYSMGITTGICLNAGFNCTQSIPVYEGHCIPHGTVQLDIGGDHVTKHLGRILSSSQGHVFNSSSEKLVLNSMKQSCCYVSQDLENEEELYKRTASMLQTYTLPDGQEIEVGTERFQAPEILFNPQSLGLNKPNSAEIIQQSIDMMESSLQSELRENIVVSGGTSKLSGYGPRLQKELSLISGPEESYNIKYTENPLLASWIGGSVLSSIGSFREQWITIDQYADHGSKIIHKMCF